MTEADLLSQVAATTGPLATMGLGFFFWLRGELSGIRREQEEIKGLAKSAKEKSQQNADRLVRLEARASIPSPIHNDTLTPVQ